MKTIKRSLLAILAITVSSCSKDEKNPDASCNEIVCGTPGDNNGNGVYYLYKGTLEPDTCGLTTIQVNQATFNYYDAKMDANPEGYACWEGLKD